MISMACYTATLSGFVKFYQGAKSLEMSNPVLQCAVVKIRVKGRLNCHFFYIAKLNLIAYSVTPARSASYISHLALRRSAISAHESVLWFVRLENNNALHYFLFCGLPAISTPLSLAFNISRCSQSHNSRCEATLVLGVIIANQFLGYFALKGEPANSTLGFCSSLPLKVKHNIHVLELFGLLRSNLMRFDPREANIGIRAFRPLGMKP